MYCIHDVKGESWEAQLTAQVQPAHAGLTVDTNTQSWPV